jgi:hypothetical protein
MIPAPDAMSWSVLGRGSARVAERENAESVARSVCGLVRTTTVLRRCDRGADEKWHWQSSE